MKARRVIDLTISEKNKLLQEHDHDFYDPIKKKRKEFDGKLNKIKGEIVLKIDHIEIPNIGPDDVYLISIPTPVHVRGKNVSGHF